MRCVPTCVVLVGLVVLLACPLLAVHTNRARYYSEEHRMIGREGIKPIQAMIPSDLKLVISEDAAPSLSRKARVKSITCVNTEDWARDELFFKILVDGRTAHLSTPVSINNDQSIDGPTKEFTFRRTFEVILVDGDAPDGDDVLGRLTIHTGTLAQNRMFQLLTSNSEYLVELEVSGSTYRPAPSASSYTLQLLSLHCEAQEDWVGKDDARLTMIIDGDSSSKFMKNLRCSKGQTVNYHSGAFPITNRAQFRYDELDKDPNDHIGTKTWYLSSKKAAIDAAGSTGVQTSVTISGDGAKYKLNFEVKKVTHSTSNRHSGTTFMAETDGLPVFYSDVVALAGDYFAQASAPGNDPAQMTLNGAISLNAEGTRRPGKQRTKSEATSTFKNTFTYWYDNLDTTFWKTAIPRFLAMFDVEKAAIKRIRNTDSELDVYSAYHDSDCKALDCVSNSADVNSARISLGQPATINYFYNTGTSALHMLMQGLRDSAYMKAAVVNLDHFNTEALIAYRAGHNEAVREACEAGKAYRSGSKDVASKKLARAFAMNAHADHFGTDQFSAGHIRNPRGQMFFDRMIPREVTRVVTTGRSNHRVKMNVTCGRDWWKSAENVGIVAKYFHDEDNILGVPVKSKDGSDAWIAYGDTILSYGKNAKNRRKAEAFVTGSAREIIDAFKGEGGCQSDCGACVRESETKKTPESLLPVYDPSATGTDGSSLAHPAYMKKVHGVWQQRKGTALQSSPTYTPDWTCSVVGAGLKGMDKDGYMRHEKALAESYFALIDANDDNEIDYSEFYSWAQSVVPQLQPGKKRGETDIDFESQALVMEMFVKFASAESSPTISRDSWVNYRVAMDAPHLTGVNEASTTASFKKRPKNLVNPPGDSSQHNGKPSRRASSDPNNDNPANNDDKNHKNKDGDRTFSTFLQMRAWRRHRRAPTRSSVVGSLSSEVDSILDPPPLVVLKNEREAGLHPGHAYVSLARFVSLGMQQIAQQRDRIRHKVTYDMCDRIWALGLLNEGADKTLSASNGGRPIPVTDVSDSLVLPIDFQFVHKITRHTSIVSLKSLSDDSDAGTAMKKANTVQSMTAFDTWAIDLASKQQVLAWATNDKSPGVDAPAPVTRAALKAAELKMRNVKGNDELAERLMAMEKEEVMVAALEAKLKRKNGKEPFKMSRKGLYLSALAGLSDSELPLHQKNLMKSINSLKNVVRDSTLHLTAFARAASSQCGATVTKVVNAGNNGGSQSEKLNVDKLLNKMMMEQGS